MRTGRRHQPVMRRFSVTIMASRAIKPLHSLKGVSSISACKQLTSNRRRGFAPGVASLYL